MLCGHGSRLSRTFYGQLDFLLLSLCQPFSCSRFVIQIKAIVSFNARTQARGANHEKATIAPKVFPLVDVMYPYTVNPKATTSNIIPDSIKLPAFSSHFLFIFIPFIMKSLKMCSPLPRLLHVSHLNFTPNQCPKVCTHSLIAPTFPQKKKKAVPTRSY